LTVDDRIAALPVAFTVAQIDSLGVTEQMFLELENRPGVFSSMLALALREHRLHGSDVGEVLRCVQNALRLAATDSVMHSQISLRARIALRPHNKEEPHDHHRNRRPRPVDRHRLGGHPGEPPERRRRLSHPLRGQ
jgi:hypothetical protein